ncbi:SCO0930 family lipoprotein [Streptomyces sp. CSDS2]|uniref:SCO0930 family lipoprotein n=1 Tax=Streptomyces sp. CSDS2 TaxID=3055051 RepID=UPI0025B00B73|nr:SCO0930 family lipoprotein [Streptomyces sp. CSDS2]MDN3260718.1 SCO0930 family lipoprotein [Streptomyces sp. CSDS2]
MKTSWRTASLVATAAAVLALTTACGQDAGTTPASAARNAGATVAAGDAAAPGGGTAIGAGNGYGADGTQDSTAPGAPAGELTVASDPGLGKVLTDGSGLTLYRFDKDTADPSRSNCSGDCATTWPPVPADDATAGAGIDRALLGEVTRADGSKQLTIGGRPAYRYAEDVNAGDVNGQGVGGTWFALTPAGEKAERSAPPGLSVRQDPELGKIVVDREGRTVYRFLKDKAWPESVSNCSGACLEKWPAVAPVAADDTKGVQKKGLMPFTRADGTRQMTVDCWPVYTFSGDKAPGDTNGQGVGGTWYAVSPDGKPVGAPGA